jgi:hypothetical protein
MPGQRTQQEEVDADLEISGPELAAAIAKHVATDPDFIRTLCNTPAFIDAVTKNSAFCDAIAKKVAAGAGPALTQGLGR